MLRAAVTRSVAFAEASGSARAAEAGSGNAVSAPTSTSATATATVATTGPRRSPINRARIGSAMRPQVIRFARRQARHVRVTAAPVRLNGATATEDGILDFAIRTLSITDCAAPTTDLALGKGAAASSYAVGPGFSEAHGPSSAVDGNPCTDWSPAAGDVSPWIQIDLGESVSFDQVRIVSPWQPSFDARRRHASRPRVSVSPDGETWTELAAQYDDDDPFTALRIELGAALPPCPGGECEPLHVQMDPATWQVFAVNHTALRVVEAGLTALVYDPFGTQLNEIEQRGVTIEPLSVAPGFVVAWPGYFPRTHLLSVRLHDADGALLCERNRWRYRPPNRH